MKTYYSLSLTIMVALILTGYAEPGTDLKNKGVGLYGKHWKPDAIYEYWDPESFHQPETGVIEGIFKGEECLDCHSELTPGIVNDWKKSKHSSPKNGFSIVSCDSCHGSNHEELVFPSPTTCKKCHSKQHKQFVDEKRYGYPSHALAMERAVDAKHFVDKPKAETASCMNCHSVATKCDSCHTRHLFSAAEARRPEACITCHSGPPHPDDETYFTSAHGKIYLKEGNQWDWSKPLKKGNYKSPTCAYCHMHGKHQMSDKSIWKFGIKEVNPQTSANKVKRAKWIAICGDCHDVKWSRRILKEMDIERKQAWKKLYETEEILKDLRSSGIISPAPDRRPPYPTDLLDKIKPFARIGYYEGQASAFYNVSLIERLYFNMWYFDNLGAYKGAAHGSEKFVTDGHKKMDKSFEMISREAHRLIKLSNEEKALGKGFNPGSLWLEGEYTIFNKENN